VTRKTKTKTKQNTRRDRTETKEKNGDLGHQDTRKMARRRKRNETRGRERR
jgi:hypothetical protein